MKLSAVETTIEVEDQPSVAKLLQFETSSLVDNSQASLLPLDGRRFLDLALLAPGVYQEMERGQLSLSGARGINSAINIDGADFNQPFGGQRGGERSNFAFVVSQEAVQEFRVVHANFSAEFGRTVESAHSGFRARPPPCSYATCFVASAAHSYRQSALGG
jgi:hypothetical protein